MHAFVDSQDFVFFWGHHEKGDKITKACFSQWYPSYFVIDGIRYNCAEQYMMAEKARVFKDEVTREKILQATEPDVIKKLGRKVHNFDAGIWNVESYKVVVRGNLAKFGQNENLKAVLLSTEKKVLIEASPYDKIWGIGMKLTEAVKTNPHNWKGTNKLGFALMEVRDELNKNKLLMKYTLETLQRAYDMHAFVDSQDFVFFWGHHEKGDKITKACFSQWYPSYFVIDGIRYNCAEQYMMAEKARVFKDEVTREKILQATEPDVIKKLGRKVQNFDAGIWNVESYKVVVRGNLAKFGQNENLKAVLLSTEKKVLVEASPYDKIWGIGMKLTEAVKTNPHNWKGNNKLGFALMEVRDELNKNK